MVSVFLIIVSGDVVVFTAMTVLGLSASCLLNASESSDVAPDPPVFALLPILFSGDVKS